MNFMKSLALMKRYVNCPSCGNDEVGNGQGSVIVDDGIFYRSCKCGWHIKTDENGKVLEESS